MRLTYVVLHVQCGCNTAHVYISKLAVPATAVGCCLFLSRDAGSVRISYSASVDDVVGLRVVGTLRYGKSSRQLKVYEILTVDLPPPTCKGTATVSRPVAGPTIGC